MKQLEILNIAIDCLTQQVNDKRVALSIVENKLADLIKDREKLTGKIVELNIKKKAANA